MIKSDQATKIIGLFLPYPLNPLHPCEKTFENTKFNRDTMDTVDITKRDKREPSGILSLRP